MVETVNPTIERAIEVVEREIEITDAERSGFGKFLSRLHDLDPGDVSAAAERASSGPPLLSKAGATGVGSPTAEPRDGSAAHRQVIEAYREAIVQLDHYDEEYGNPVSTDMALEFGEEVAYALFEASDLNPIVHERLVVQAERSLENREKHARHLDREVTSLVDCDDDLGEIEAAYVESPRPTEVPAEMVSTVREELLALERRCQELVTRRQEMLHSRPNSSLGGVDGQSLNRYLYDHHLSVTCPVLRDVVGLCRRIEAERERAESVLADLDRRPSGSLGSTDD